MNKAIFILNEYHHHIIYPPDVYDSIKAQVDVVAPFYTKESIQDNLSVLEDVTILFSGWGCPKLDATFFNHAPNLKAVFYGAGSVRGFTTPEFWERDIVLCNSASINAEPVAYFTFSQILFGLKGGWHHVRHGDSYRDQKQAFSGIHGSTVGIISLGYIGRRVCEFLRQINVRVLIYDPFATDEDARQLGGERCDLDTIFRESDVVSLHTPLLDETRGMLQGKHFEQMKSNSVFINTARGAIIREDEMIAVLQDRSDIMALLDVTYPEPPVADSPLRTLPNVVLTPHIAGAIGTGEIREFGVTMSAELKRYLSGQPLLWQVTYDKFIHMA